MKNAFIFIGGVILGVYGTVSYLATSAAVKILNENDKAKKDDE